MSRQDETLKFRYKIMRSPMRAPIHSIHPGSPGRWTSPFFSPRFPEKEAKAPCCCRRPRVRIRRWRSWKPRPPRPDRTRRSCSAGRCLAAICTAQYRTGNRYTGMPPHYSTDPQPQVLIPDTNFVTISFSQALNLS